MAETTITGLPAGDQESAESISIVQRGNLKTLEHTLRRQWRLGQNIVLCWSADERGLLVIFVPHYFLGNYCASGGEVTQKAGLPIWILVLGGAGIVVGLATMGYKVMR